MRRGSFCDCEILRGCLAVVGVFEVGEVGGQDQRSGNFLRPRTALLVGWCRWGLASVAAWQGFYSGIGGKAGELGVLPGAWATVTTTSVLDVIKDDSIHWMFLLVHNSPYLHPLRIFRQFRPPIHIYQTQDLFTWVMPPSSLSRTPLPIPQFPSLSSCQPHVHNPTTQPQIHLPQAQLWHHVSTPP